MFTTTGSVTSVRAGAHPLPRSSTASRIDFPVRVHDLQHVHLLLLGGGTDVTSVLEPMGHSQIQTTQEYLRTLRDTDQRNLDALTRVQTALQPQTSSGVATLQVPGFGPTATAMESTSNAVSGQRQMTRPPLDPSLRRAGWSKDKSRGGSPRPQRPAR